MATSDLPTLRDQLPAVFEDMDPPHGWDDYHVIPVDTEGDSDFEIDPLVEDPGAQLGENQSAPEVLNPYGLDPAEAFKEGDGFSGVECAVTFPGTPRAWTEGEYPPTDALAFYLPFHFYYPDLWGIYLIKEGVNKLTRYLRIQSGWDGEKKDWKLSQQKAEVAARLFLYYHEAFHHNVESMATRLEVTHRQPLYRRGFLDFFRRTFMTEKCLEEALANAHAFRKVSKAFNRKGWRTGAIRSGLREYIEGQPPGYDRGMEFEDKEFFDKKRNEFAELNHRESLPIVEKDGALWNLFSYAFYGIARIDSHTNYLVRKDSPLLDRDDLHGRYIGYRDLKDKLDELVGLHLKREGKGSHEIYETDAGDSVTLYYTTGDVPKGTLNSILKDAGVEMNVHDFLRAQV